jgi:hypothetical protein
MSLFGGELVVKIFAVTYDDDEKERRRMSE